MTHYDQVHVSFERETLKQLKQFVEPQKMTVEEFIKQATMYAVHEMVKEAEKIVKAKADAEPQKTPTPV